MSRTTALNALFLVAGCTSAVVETLLYRVCLILIVLLLRALWARAAIKRSRSALIGEISRRALASRRATLEAPEQYQGADLPLCEYYQG